MTNLDINTPRGQETLKQERRAATLFEISNPDLKYIETPKSTIAAVDAVIVRGSIVAAVAETKCRLMTLAQLRVNFHNEWLVTLDKILRGAQVADLLQVPLAGLLYLVPDDLLLQRVLFRPGIGWVSRFRVERTETRATVNGGEAFRANAFIDMTNAAEIRAEAA